MGYDYHVYMTIIGDIDGITISKIVSEYGKFKFMFTEDGYDTYEEREVSYGFLSPEVSSFTRKEMVEVHKDEVREIEVSMNEWFIIGSDDRGELSYGVSDRFIIGFSKFSKLFPDVKFRMFITLWDNMSLYVYDFTNGTHKLLLEVYNDGECSFTIYDECFDFLNNDKEMFSFLHNEDDDDDDDDDRSIDIGLYMRNEIDISEYFEELYE